MGVLVFVLFCFVVCLTLRLHLAATRSVVRGTDVGICPIKVPRVNQTLGFDSLLSGNLYSPELLLAARHHFSVKMT